MGRTTPRPSTTGLTPPRAPRPLLHGGLRAPSMEGASDNAALPPPAQRR